MEEMNPELKPRLLEALRSGKYEQGRGQLRDNSDAFCFFGVVCDLYDDSLWGHRAPLSDVAYDGFISSPPDSVEEWSGLSVAHTKVTIAGVRACLMDHNDGNTVCGVEPRTFAEIADAIEDQL